MLGYRPGEFAGATTGLAGIAAEIVHPDDCGGTMSRLAEAAREPGLNRGPVARIRHRDGSWRYMEWAANNLSGAPDVDGLVFISRDVTERVRAEEEVRRLNEELEGRVAKRTKQLEITVSKLLTSERMLLESEDRFRVAFDQAAVGIAHSAPDGRWLRVNRRFCEILGYTREEMLALTFQDITHPEDLDDSLEHVRRVFSGEIETYSTEKRYVRKDGSRVWVSLTVSLVRGPLEGPDYFVSVVVDDIDVRKRSEEYLRSLTPREVEVLVFLARGLTNREIARSMRFSEGTAKIHVQHVITKLGVAGRAQAAARAAELGLTESER